MTRTTQPEMLPHCRLATTLPEYADEHQRCPGNAEVRIASEHPELQIPVLTYRCDCTCHAAGVSETGVSAR